MCTQQHFLFDSKRSVSRTRLGSGREEGSRSVVLIIVNFLKNPFSPKTIKKMVIGSYISVIALNVNGLKAPTKRHRVGR